jgi:hypothetical protein
MSIIQVAREGNSFVVQSDGATIPGLRFATRGAAVRAALAHKEESA